MQHHNETFWKDMQIKMLNYNLIKILNYFFAFIIIIII